MIACAGISEVMIDYWVIGIFIFILTFFNRCQRLFIFEYSLKYVEVEKKLAVRFDYGQVSTVQ